MSRKDKGIRRSDKTPDRVFSFKLNPDDAIEGPIVDAIDVYRSKYPEAGLRQIIVDVFSRVDYRPPTREDAVLEIQDRMQEQIERLIGIIDKLMASGGTLRPGGERDAVISHDADEELDLNYLAEIKSTMKRSY